MSDVDFTDLDALTVFLRSKTALVRLNDGEVRDVLSFLANMGFTAPTVVPPVQPEQPDAEPAPVIAPPPGDPAPETDPATTIAPPPVS